MFPSSTRVDNSEKSICENIRKIFSSITDQQVEQIAHNMALHVPDHLGTLQNAALLGLKTIMKMLEECNSSEPALDDSEPRKSSEMTEQLKQIADEFLLNPQIRLMSEDKKKLFVESLTKSLTKKIKESSSLRNLFATCSDKTPLLETPLFFERLTDVKPKEILETAAHNAKVELTDKNLPSQYTLTLHFENHETNKTMNLPITEYIFHVTYSDGDIKLSKWAFTLKTFPTMVP